MKIFRPKESLKNKTVFMAFNLKDSISEPEFFHNLIALLAQKGANLKIIENSYTKVVAKNWFDKYKKDYNNLEYIQHENVEKSGILFSYNYNKPFPQEIKTVSTSLKDSDLSFAPSKILKEIQDYYNLDK